MGDPVIETDPPEPDLPPVDDTRVALPPPEDDPDLDHAQDPDATYLETQDR